MNADTYDLLILSCYHVVIAILGFLIALLGYSLFRNKIDEPAGDVTVEVANRRFAVRRGAPGTFFVVLGAAVIISTVAEGIHMSTKYSSSDAQSGNGQDTNARLDRETHFDGLTGSASARPLSYTLLESIRDYAQCLQKYAPGTDANDCEKQLDTRIKNFPSDSDIQYLEKLELTPPDKRDADWQQKMIAERNALLGLH